MKRISLFILLGTIIFACSQGAAPPIDTEIATSPYTHGRVVWHNLASPDPEASASFYEAVFGWNAVPYGEGNRKVWVYQKSGEPIALMAQYRTKDGSGEWIGAISVPNVDEAVEKARSMGAAVLEDTRVSESLGTVGFIQDAQGANISFIKFTNGDPEPGFPETDDFLGLELWSNNPEESISFYTDIIGYQTAKMDGVGIDYTMFQMDGKNCASVMQNPAEDTRSHWVPYVRVSDLNATVAKVKSAGGTMLVEPSPEIRGGTAALFLDPTGAPMAIQVYNP
ncbi:VOC family protein [Algoriphagus sediminis]|uniref:VOC family protein n=1 Tax=Algoriphagus sediminis TaxID=3057113 RepID=A0ABT7Y8J4_9BACT|nr:VOC family protein [Algoriphagus sediminis]MDN3202821.1 VOC family protein [Algoriphagus sediminis]